MIFLQLIGNVAGNCRKLMLPDCTTTIPGQLTICAGHILKNSKISDNSGLMEAKLNGQWIFFNDSVLKNLTKPSSTSAGMKTPTK